MHFLCLGLLELANGFEGAEASIVRVGMEMLFRLAGDDIVVVVWSHVLIVL